MQNVEFYVLLSSFFDITHRFLETVNSDPSPHYLYILLPIEVPNVTEEYFFIHIRHSVTDFQRPSDIDFVAIKHKASVRRKQSHHFNQFNCFSETINP